MSHATKQTTSLKKVLIIEDEGDMCLLLNILLNGKDMELDHVKSIAAAKKYLEQEKPSVILLDNKLPDGFMATPAVAGNALYLRTRTTLYRVEK